MSNAAIILTTLIVYKGLLIAIGVWASRRTGTEADYLIGGAHAGAVGGGSVLCGDLVLGLGALGLFRVLCSWPG